LTVVARPSTSGQRNVAPSPDPPGRR
jgi:hypothetical protein